MEVPHPSGRFVRGDRFELATRLFVDVVKELAEMGVSVWVVDKGVLETSRFLNGLEPCVEFLGCSDRRGQATI